MKSHAELAGLVAEAREEAENGQRASAALLLRELAQAVEDLDALRGTLEDVLVLKTYLLGGDKA